MTDPDATSRTRATLTQWISAFNDRRQEDLHRLFAPDAKWSLIGRLDRAPWALEVSGEDLLKRSDNALVFETWEFNVENLIIDNNKAVIEASGKGRGPGSLAYNQNFLMRFILNDEGKVKNLRVALDAYEVEAFQANYAEWTKEQDKQQ